MKKFFEDFKAFIAKGNVIDMAVAVVIGGAFGKIVTSLVNDIVMPLISLLTKGVAVSDWKYVITPADEAAGIAESAINYGIFLQNIIDFLIIAFVIFAVLRVFLNVKSKFEKKEEAIEEEKEPEETELDILKEIRDSLKEKADK
ncbi:MAG: large-conductance mechanosensitive channel protein MscL [Ruminococcaceae bacterium]|nr:large-conductance mechanosensitive channel protein MscL [Oscillospiraceae bacterium]